MKLSLGFLLAIRLFAYTPVPVIRWASFGFSSHIFTSISGIPGLHMKQFFFLFTLYILFERVFGDLRPRGADTSSQPHIMDRPWPRIVYTKTDFSGQIEINEQAGSGGFELAMRHLCSPAHPALPSHNHHISISRYTMQSCVQWVLGWSALGCSAFQFRHAGNT
jgi:hypothetical protein